MEPVIVICSGLHFVCIKKFFVCREVFGLAYKFSQSDSSLAIEFGQNRVPTGWVDQIAIMCGRCHVDGTRFIQYG